MKRFENTTRTSAQSCVKVEHQPGEAFVELSVCTVSGARTVRIESDQLEMLLTALRIADDRMGSAANA